MSDTKNYCTNCQEVTGHVVAQDYFKKPGLRCEVCEHFNHLRVQAVGELEMKNENLAELKAFEEWWPKVEQTIGKVAAWAAWQERAIKIISGGDAPAAPAPRDVEQALNVLGSIVGDVAEGEYDAAYAAMDTIRKAIHPATPAAQAESKLNDLLLRMTKYIEERENMSPYSAMTEGKKLDVEILWFLHAINKEKS